MTARSTALRRSAVMAAGAFVLYGGWAAYANRAYGLATAFKAAVTQGAISFLVTLFMTLILEFIFHSIGPKFLRFIVTAVGTQTVVAVMTFTVHYIVGTPEILVTMAPSFIVSSTYSILYTTGLHIRDRQRAR